MSAEAIPPPTVEALRSDDDVGGFQSREDSIQEFLRVHAWKNDTHNLSRTYLCRSGASEGGSLRALLGYHSLAMGRITLTDLPKDKRPSAVDMTLLPVAILARIGRDLAAPKNIGDLLMWDVFRRVNESADRIGCTGILLHAINRPKLIEWYQGWDFVTLGKTPQKPEDRQAMFLELSVVKAALAMEAAEPM